MPLPPPSTDHNLPMYFALAFGPLALILSLSALAAMLKATWLMIRSK